VEGFGLQIRRARQRAGLTQHQFAAKIGVDRSAVSNWEREIYFPERYEHRINDELGIALVRPRGPALADDTQRLLRRDLGDRKFGNVMNFIERGAGDDAPVAAAQ
jgi:transcriptional regulator with XRE-family HTH domain